MCKSAEREDAPGQDFHFNEKAAGGGGRAGAWRHGQKISLAPIHLWNPLKLFILSRLWGKVEKKYECIAGGK